VNYLKLSLLFALFITACANQSTTPKMFNSIDPKLNEMAKQLRTRVETTVGGASLDNTKVPEDKLVTRKILWTEGAISKGIIINQNFENRNINAPDWDFLIIAWNQNVKTASKGHPFWQQYLLRKVKLEKIEQKIDSLLKESLIILATVKESDLGYE